MAPEACHAPDELTSLMPGAEAIPDELTRFAPSEMTELLVSAPEATPGLGTRDMLETELAGFITSIRAEARRAGLDESQTLDLLGTAQNILERYVDDAGRPAEPQTATPAEPSLPVDAAQWSVPPGAMLLNTFAVRTLLARGGMGEIYRVRHRDLKTDHAVKVIVPEYRDDTKVVGLFHEEARLLQKVRHEAVVDCAGLFRGADGRSMIVLDYVDGPSLSYFMRRGPFGLGALEALLRRLAAGLSAIHAAGVVHRDVSPDNILLPGDSPAAAKIIDFGVAREMRGGVTPRDGLDFAGKFSFASPEQLGLFGGAIGIASDIYSLGLVIAAAARGEKLPMGQMLEEATEARRRVPPLTEVPERLRGLVEAMLQPDPKRRPTDLAALIQTLPATGTPKKSFWRWFGRRNARPTARS
ncbi:MAG TPA: serine/threonine-protein kinase [Stellaceae bacterium]|nr:serine/threonine-protein kinase [Stellaceae bacterium]